MKLSLSLLTLALALVYGVIKQYFPDFPLDEKTLLAFVAYVLVKLGVEIVEPIARAFLVKKGLRGFAK